jgi:Na+/melibiose symporter-like transporter
MVAGTTHAVSTKRKIAYGFGGLGGGIVDDAIISYLFLFYNTVLTLDASVVAAALLTSFAGVTVFPLATWFLFTPNGPALVFVFFFFLGVPAVAVQIVIYSMLADICDLDELRSG